MSPGVPKSWREHRNVIKKKKWHKTERYLKTLNEYSKQNEETVDEEPKSDIRTRAAPYLKTAPTLSIALPGSILDNAQTQEFRSYLAGQIARAVCIYNIREVIIFDDMPAKNDDDFDDNYSSHSWKSCVQLGNILQYLECPQYLRKHLYPMCDDLKYAGLLNPLDAPHHLRATDDSPFREGVITEKINKSGTKSYAEVGLDAQIRTDSLLTKGTRVTLKLKRSSKKDKLKGTVVRPEAPTEEEGLYWGYSVRLAERLSDVFSESPFGEYDFTIGTSDRGEPWNQLTLPEAGFNHGLLVFGGVKGLEFALSRDQKLEVDDVSLLFDAYVNTCLSQGARTIRTEEALLISLAVITHKFGFCN